MNERLGVFMREQNMTAAKLAEILQIQPSSISHLLSGRNKPNFDFIARILRMFSELNPDWLINGYGSMYRDQNQFTGTSKAEDVKLDNQVTNHSMSDLISDKEEVTSNTNVTQDDLFSSSNNGNIQQNSVTAFQDTPKEEQYPSIEKIEKTDNQSAIDKIIVFYSDQTFSIYNQR